jgi:hypothetical protein
MGLGTATHPIRSNIAASMDFYLEWALISVFAEETTSLKALAKAMKNKETTC